MKKNDAWGVLMSTQKANAAKELEAVHEAWVALSEELRGIGGARWEIDEMALYIHDQEYLNSWVRAAVAIDGYQMFNTATDTVRSTPIACSYDVEYSFVSTPHPYRLEIMRLTGGYSALHSRYEWADTAVGSRGTYPVHASFKCEDEEDLAVAVGTLRKDGWELAQRCDSSYGKFSYYTNEYSLTGWFLKPRVNLRDAVKSDD